MGLFSFLDSSASFHGTNNNNGNHPTTPLITTNDTNNNDASTGSSTASSSWRRFIDSSPTAAISRPRSSKKALNSANTSLNLKLLVHLTQMVFFSIIYIGDDDNRKENAMRASYHKEASERNQQQQHQKDEENSPILSPTAASDTSPSSPTPQENPSTTKKSKRIPFWRRHISNFTRIFMNLLFILFNIAIEVAKTNVSYQMSLYTGQTTGALVFGFEHQFSSEAWRNFVHILLMASIWIVGSAILKTIHYFVIEQMMVWWRWVLVSNLHRIYFADRRFFWSTGVVENVDQRIQADTDTYVDLWRKIMQDVVGAPMIIVTFTYHSFRMAGWQGPAAIYAYFIGGIIVSKLLIGPVSKRWDAQKEKEGDLRYAHTTVRTCAESVALLQGGQREKQDCDNLLKKAIRNRFVLSIHEVFLNFHMNLFGYAGSILNYTIIAVCAFYFGKFKAQDTAAFSALIGTASYQMLEIIFGFTTIVQVGGFFSELAGVTGRLGLFLDSMKSVDKLQEQSRTDRLELPLTNEDVCDEIASLDNEFYFYQFSLSDPNHNKLIEYIPALRIQKGMHTLISGDSGAGKSTLIRTLCDMWLHYKGLLIKPNKNTMYVIPQNTYCSRGTLKEQITYPLKSQNLRNEYGRDTTDDLLVDCLRKARLSYLLERSDLDKEENWPKILSGGERQRLAFCRLFYKYAMYGADAVSWIILDEATSSMPIDTEEKIMNQVLKLHENITVVSVGHRPTLNKFHKYVLRLGVGDIGTGYSFEEIKS